METFRLEVSEGMKSGDLLDTYATIARVLIIITIILFSESASKMW